MKKLMLAAALGLALPLVAPATAGACPCSKKNKVAKQNPSPACGDKGDTTAKKDGKKKSKKSDKKS
jgi:hypothetical protein